jgi:hypothetical protein
MAELIPPAPLAHVAPFLSGDALGVVIIDTVHPDARGGSLRVSKATLRKLPALISEAIARFDRQRGDRAA